MEFLDLVQKFKQQEYIEGDFFNFTQTTDADAQSLHELYTDSFKYDAGGVTLATAPS